MIHTNNVRNFYWFLYQDITLLKRVNSITQVAFTLQMDLHYVEYYLSRGMSINDFGPNLSFFFSNG
jgi:methylmalonyl-CoA mutase